MCELEFCYDFVYAVEEKLGRAIDGINESVGMLLKIG